jgi:hypothetical protein
MTTQALTYGIVSYVKSCASCYQVFISMSPSALIVYPDPSILNIGSLGPETHVDDLICKTLCV